MFDRIFEFLGNHGLKLWLVWMAFCTLASLTGVGFVFYILYKVTMKL
jgi:hypothetical protein